MMRSLGTSSCSESSQTRSDPFACSVFLSKVPEKLPEASASKKRYLVIFKTPETAQELAEQGFEFDGALNCGPQPNCDGAKLVEKMLYSRSPVDDALNYLDSRGVKLIINPAFTTPDLSWPEAKRKAGI